GAKTTRRWHQENKLRPGMRGLHVSRDSACAFAWFCPEEDARLDEALASAILGAPGAPEDWPERMRGAGINHVIVYSPDLGQGAAALERLLADPVQWPLLYLEGGLAVFGWRDPARPREPDPFRGLEYDLNRLAFHPDEVRKAPRTRPDREPGSRQWWEALWKPAPRRTLDGEEATLHLLHAGVLRRSAPRRHRGGGEARWSAGLVGAAAGWPGPGGLFDARLRLAVLRPRLPGEGAVTEGPPGPDWVGELLRKSPLGQQDDVPPALLYL